MKVEVLSRGDNIKAEFYSPQMVQQQTNVQNSPLFYLFQYTEQSLIKI